MKKMGKRSSDSTVQQKSSKKSRELKDLGPTLEDLKYGCESDGTLSRPSFWMGPVAEEVMRQRRQTHSSDDESYTCTLSPEEEARYRSQNREYSETGLQYYNKKNGTNYELVDSLDHVAFIYGPVWVHCNVTAKPQMNPNGDMDAESQLFFAEMYWSYSLPKRLIVVTCRRLLKGKTKTTTDGCECCGGPLKSTIIHPTNGFRIGHPEYEARTLRPRAGCKPIPSFF